MNHDERSWKTVLPFIVGIVTFTLLAMFNEIREFDLWRNYALSGVFMGSIVTWVVWHYDVRVPHYIQWIIIGALMLHYGGGSLGSPDPYKMGLLGVHGINGAYHVFEWWDNLTHGAGIGAGAMGVAYMLEVFQLRRGLGWSAPFVGIIAVLSALAAGVGVEMYEYLGKTVFQTIDQGGFVNTMTDLLFNLLGALIGAIAAVLVNRGPGWTRIQDQWGQQKPDQSLWRPMPSNMLGYLAFVSIPAAMSLVLGLRFLVFGGEETPGAYDVALDLLVQSALWGTVAAVTVAIVAREVHRRLAPEVKA